MKRTVSGKLLAELWRMERKRYDYLGEGLLYVFDDPERSKQAYAQAEKQQQAIDEKLKEIAENSDDYTSLVARGLARAIGVLPLSKLKKCVEICADVEVVEE